MAKREGSMLAYAYDDRRFMKWDYEAIAQPKIEGDRCRAVFDAQGKVQLISSGLKDRNFSVPHIVKDLEGSGLTNCELDGELYRHGWAHEQIRSVVARTTNLHPDFEEITYNIFDYINLTSKQEVRTQLLRSLMKEIRTPNLQFVESTPINSRDEMIYLYDRFIAEGYEGIILRNRYGLYTRKKSTNLMKLKPRLSDTYVLLKMDEQCDINGKPKDTLGAVWLLDTEQRSFKVGVFKKPWDKKALKKIWDERGTRKPTLVKIRYQALTEDKQVPKMASVEDFIYT